TPSACKFPVIFHKNAREYIKYSLRFLFHLTKNLTTHLSHNLCAVLPFSTGQENDLLSCFCFIPSCENFVEMLDKYRGVCYNIKYDNRRSASFNREKRIHKRVGVFLQKW
ncbi:MAG: hypothetical protein SOY50_02070, partial [Ruminococcus callidus]|nr:hypothetical protein [Ruminococcus callidus]